MGSGIGSPFSIQAAHEVSERRASRTFPRHAPCVLSAELTTTFPRHAPCVLSAELTTTFPLHAPCVLSAELTTTFPLHAQCPSQPLHHHSQTP